MNPNILTPDEEYLDIQLVEIMIYQSPALTRGQSVFINKATGTVCTRPDKVMVGIQQCTRPIKQPVRK
jgi:hypothetical protein